MIRLLDQHHVRTQKELDGIWRYIRQDGKEYALPVPRCLEQHPDLLNYRGKGVFHKEIYVKEHPLRSRPNIRLEFKGVSHTADIFFDNVWVTKHYNAYTRFDAVIRDAEPGIHELKVCVDNSLRLKT